MSADGGHSAEGSLHLLLGQAGLDTHVVDKLGGVQIGTLGLNSLQFGLGFGHLGFLGGALHLLAFHGLLGDLAGLLASLGGTSSDTLGHGWNRV